MSQSDILPVGCTLSVDMIPPPDGVLSPMAAGGFICYVIAQNVGYMNYNSLELTQPNAFRYVRNGSTATFETTFNLITGSYIAAGPVTVNEEGKVEINLLLYLGDDPERAFVSDFDGYCVYNQSFTPTGDSTVPASNTSGEGYFHVDPNGSSSDISTTVTATSSSDS
jgi:hypothetical protein